MTLRMLNPHTPLSFSCQQKQPPRDESLPALLANPLMALPELVIWPVGATFPQ